MSVSGIYCLNIVGYEPADLTVHPPPPHRTAEGGFIFFVYVSSIPPKNILKGKPDCAFRSYSGQKDPKRVFFHYIHSYQILINLKLFHNIE